ncbi:hypothetical protein ACFSTC_13120 [Nonomuraea ferruginea]
MSIGAFWSDTPMNFNSVVLCPPVVVVVVSGRVEQAVTRVAAARPPIMRRKFPRLSRASRSRSVIVSPRSCGGL